eukprot:1799054-Alexandrium_andersonii.AAC.1
MSASLVGSEMCIRDRPPLLLPSCGSLDARSVSCPKTQGRTDLREAAPVSYTHLTLPTICSV